MTYCSTIFFFILFQTLSIMFTLVLVGLVVGGLVYFLVQGRKKRVLTVEDGWWGAGAPPDGAEDITIKPFTITTSDEELEVSFGMVHYDYEDESV